MLNENLRILRKSKGLSQEGLAVKLNVVRQTVSKWEKGISVPDSEMLIAISEVLETPVSTLLGENINEMRADDIKIISEKLENINLQFAKKKIYRRKLIRLTLVSVCILIALCFAVFLFLDSPYLGWDYSDPELAVTGVIFHITEWVFVRIAPVILIAAIIGIILTYRNSDK